VGEGRHGTCALAEPGFLHVQGEDDRIGLEMGCEEISLAFAEMNSKNHFSLFQNVYCVSLKRSTERRDHIRQEFQRVGLKDFEFIDARDKHSDEVLELYESDFVAKYPPCFRCKQMECDCANKSLFHAQIGNWLSHMEAWKRVSECPSGKLTMICEDDLKFQENVHDTMALLHASNDIAALLDLGQSLLVRLGWALCEDHSDSATPRLTKQIRLANPCYAINPQMARRLLNSLEKIDTTSDVYLHTMVGLQACHFTVVPPLAYELSWSTGELPSEIRPKQGYVDHLTRQLQERELAPGERAALQEKIERETRRIAEFEEFNSNPTADYHTKLPLI
jgi:GR25 family glycosyltransferase involved in LPS biosynthesis